MLFKESTLYGDGGELKFGGRRKVGGADRLLRVVVIGALAAFLAAGASTAVGEMEWRRQAGFDGILWGLHVDLEENGAQIVSEMVVSICSRGQFHTAGGGEGNAFWAQVIGLNRRAESSLEEMSSHCACLARILGKSRGVSLALRGGEEVCSGERSLWLPSSVRRNSLPSLRMFDARSDGAGGVSGLSRLVENGERFVETSPAMLSEVLIADQQGPNKEESSGAEPEESTPPGLVVGLLCVAAVAGALAGRHVGHPVGKREGRK